MNRLPVTWTTLALTALLLQAGCAPRPGHDEGPSALTQTSSLIEVDGFHLHLHCQGDGLPVVVLDTGISETYRTWVNVLEEISRNNRVCGYDRAGYGESEGGPYPRSARQVASELALLLTEASAKAEAEVGTEVGAGTGPGTSTETGSAAQTGITPPYLLVGHSLGALHSLVFASEYPDLVGGMVLVDPPPLGFLSGERFPELGQMFEMQVVEFRRIAAGHFASGQEAEAVFFETLASEQEMMLSESLHAVAAIDNLGNLPLIVISAGTPNPAFGQDAEEFQAFWIESNREVAALSSRGRFVLAENSGHHVHVDDPEIVISAIRDLTFPPREEDRPD